MKKILYLALFGLLLISCSTKKVLKAQETQNVKTEIYDKSVQVKTDSIKVSTTESAKTENNESIVEIQNQFTPIDKIKPLEIIDPAGKTWHIKNGTFTNTIKKKNRLEKSQINKNNDFTATSKIKVNTNKKFVSNQKLNKKTADIKKSSTPLFLNILAFIVIILIIGYLYFFIFKK